MKIAVTGGTGFLGQHVMKIFSERDIHVTYTLRNQSSGSHFLKNNNSVLMDIYSPPSNIFETLGKPDVLLHLAWGGLPNYNSLHHFSEELFAQYNFLSHLIEQGLPALVSTGTCFEYGMEEGALSAEMRTYPTNPYGFAKDSLCKQLMYLQANQFFSFTWARLFYMYGTGQAENSLFTSLKMAVERGDRVFKMSEGEQLRDFLPVEDVAKSLVDLTIQADNKGVINICSGQPISIRQLVEQWIDENNWDIELALNEYPYPDYEPFAFWGVT